MQRLAFLLTVLAFPFAAPAAVAQPADLAGLPAGTYALDRSHANIVFRVTHLGFSQYVGRFNAFDATLTFDPAAPEASALTVRVDPASVDTNNAKLEGELREEKFFNAPQFPEITFVSTKVERTGDRTGTVSGDLTMLGVTKPVTFDVELVGAGKHPFLDAQVLGFSATGTIDRTAFGMDFLTPMVGATVDVRLDAEFHHQP